MTSMIDAVVVGGGQSGLAAAGALQSRGLDPVILEAGERPVGSWPSYYDSLTLFSPARYSSLPGMPFPGDPDRYPHRDEVVSYLGSYADHLGLQVRTRSRVREITKETRGFSVSLNTGEDVRARLVIAATGGFGRPHRPRLPGHGRYAGVVLHASEYRHPTPFRGQRVVVVGAGNSAIQIATELAEHATVTLATRQEPRLVRQRPLGKDLHFWLHASRLDRLPIDRLLPLLPGGGHPVLDDGRYGSAIKAGRPDRRDMFANADEFMVTWADDQREHVDAIIMATGYRPDLGYLSAMGALDSSGQPHQRRGISTVQPGTGYVGLDMQRSLSSATLRGVGRDAAFVAASLAAGTRFRAG